MAGPALRRSQSKSAPPPLLDRTVPVALPHLTRPGVRKPVDYREVLKASQCRVVIPPRTPSRLGWASR